MEVSNSMLKRGTSEMLILYLLSKEDMYGYQLTHTLNSLSDNQFSLTEGSLYPILYRLMEKNMVSDVQKIVGKRLRIYYHLKDEGKEYLNTLINDYEKLTSLINKIITS